MLVLLARLGGSDPMGLFMRSLSLAKVAAL